MRPGTLMFNDKNFNSFKTNKQEENFKTFHRSIFEQDYKAVIIEIGANDDVPQLRTLSEQLNKTL